MTDGSQVNERSQRASGLVTLGRDVGVNVLANLIAAAVIYLLGAFIGLLPRQPAAIYSALVLLLSTVGTAVSLAWVVYLRQPAGRWLAVAAGWLGTIFVALVTFAIPDRRMQILLWCMSGLIGLLTLALTVLRARLR